MDDNRGSSLPRRDYALPQPANTQPASTSTQIPVSPAPPDQPVPPPNPYDPMVSSVPTPRSAERPIDALASPYPAQQPSAYTITPAPTETLPLDQQFKTTAEVLAKPDNQKWPASHVPILRLKYLVSAAFIALGLAAGGFYYYHPVTKKGGLTVAELSQKAGFAFYYPQNLPAGYSYANDQNAVSDGQTYYMLADGSKHIVVHEQSSNSGKLDLTSLTNVSNLATPTGQAAIGNNAGQLAASVLVGSTQISIYSTGQVSQSDIINIINSLKTVSK